MSDPNEQQPLPYQDGPDGLDELLQRTEIPEEEDGFTRYGTGGHRKSYSLGHVAFDLDPRRAHQRRAHVRRHRKQVSSISELKAVLRSGDLEPIREDLRETAVGLRRTFVHNLDEMDRGETGMFDMSMTRSLSVLPENLADLAMDFGMKEPTEEEEEARVPLVQYLMLFTAVVGVSSNSTALHMLDGVSPPMKLFWRMTASYVTLSPLTLYYLYQYGLPQLSLGGWITFVLAIVCYSAHTLLFYFALQLTTIGNAVIYGNSQALLLIIGKACVGERIHILEGLGVAVAFSGAVLCSVDSEGSAKASEGPSLAYVGDLMALGSAVTGVAYLTFAKAIRSEMGATVFISYVMFFGSVFVLSLMAILGMAFEWNTDPYDGLFGWFNLSHHRLPILLWLAVVVNLLGTMGFVRAMQYFDTVIIAVATLTEPLMASLIAFACHAGLLPGPLGWFGNFLVVIGTLSVVYPSMGKKDAGGMH